MRFVWFIKTVTLIVYIPCGDFINWCDGPLQCNNEKNYACGDCPIAKGCQVIKMDNSIRFAIQRVHNARRSQVATGKEEQVPEKVRKASNMLALSYDVDLEYLAECWLKQCKFEHTKCQKLPPSLSVGQNLFQSSKCSGLTELAMGAAQKWYDEVEKTPAEVYKKFSFGMSYGHYTQLVWANTWKIGCAASKASDGKCLFACNYATAGNVLGEAVYDQGEPASRCPSTAKKNKKLPGLCGDPYVYNVTDVEQQTEEITPRETLPTTTRKITTTTTHGPLGDSDEISEEEKKSEITEITQKTGTSYATIATKTNREKTSTNRNEKHKVSKHKSSTESMKNPVYENSVVASDENKVLYEEKTNPTEPGKRNNVSFDIFDLPWMQKYQNQVTTTSKLPKMLDLPWMKDRYTSDEVEVSKDKPNSESKFDDLPWMFTPEMDEFLPITLNDLPWRTRRTFLKPVVLPIITDLPWMTTYKERRGKPLVDLQLLRDLPWIKHKFLKRVKDKRDNLQHNNN